MRQAVGALVAAFSLALAALPGVADLPGLKFAGASAAAPEPTRILVVGDSATHGSSGDWTWRYRLWEHLHRVGANVDFVGPFTDVKALGRDAFSHEYQVPDFDRDHASRWGYSFGFHEPIGELIAAHRPDVVIEMLGVNNLTWQGKSPEAVDRMLRTFVADARAADPGIDLVLSTVPQTWFPNVAEFNALARETAAGLDTAVSPVAVAHSDVGYRERDHTWDPGHPNAAGELRLAAAVQDALVELGVGTPMTRPLPQVPLGPRAAPRLSGTARDGSVSLSWQGARVATSQRVEGRDLTAGTGWRTFDEVDLEDPQQWSAPVANGHRFQFRLRPVKGYWPAQGVRSNTVRLHPGPRPPGGITAKGSPFAQARVTWTAVPGADSYQVRVRRVGAVRWRVLPSTTLRRQLVTGLPGRQRYQVGVRSWRGGVAGPFRAARPVLVPAPRPVLGVRASSPARDRVRVGFLRRSEAVRFQIRVAAAATCRPAARPARFRVAKAVTGPPAVVNTRARALWVRVVGVRAGVAGRIAPRSTGCTRVR